MTAHTPPPYVPQQQPQAPVQMTQGPSNGFPVTSLVLGIVSLLGFGLLTGIPAVIFGGIALRRKQPDHGMSLAGVITGSIGTFFSLLFIIFMTIVVVIGHNSGYYNEPAPYYDGYSEQSENPRT